MQSIKRETQIVSGVVALSATAAAAAPWFVVGRDVSQDSLIAALGLAAAALIAGLAISFVVLRQALGRGLANEVYSDARSASGALVTVLAILAVIAGNSLMPAVLLAAAWIGAVFALREASRGMLARG